MTATRCPTCAAELRDSSICFRCGTLPGVESRVQKAKLGISAFVARKTESLPRRFEARHFLWLCALIPFFLVPPFASLIYSIRAMRNKTNQNVAADFEWIAIVSAINILVSALLLYKFYFVINDLYMQGPDAVRAFFRGLFRVFTPGPPPIKLTPA